MAQEESRAVVQTPRVTCSNIVGMVDNISSGYLLHLPEDQLRVIGIRRQTNGVHEVANLWRGFGPARGPTAEGRNESRVPAPWRGGPGTAHVPGKNRNGSGMNRNRELCRSQSVGSESAGFQRLGQMPERFVQPDVFIQPGHGPRARKPRTVGLAPGIILQPAPN